MPPMNPPDVWAVGEAYEAYVGRWSRLVARDFIDWLALPASGRWLDLGCGVGALTQAILARAEPASVIGVDPSDGFVAHARHQTRDERASFRSGKAEALPLPDESFDAVVAGLVLNFIPHPEQALTEMRRVLRPGGTAAVYVWDYAGEMQLMRHFWNAAVCIDPAAATLDEAWRFPICKPEPLLALFNDGGFEPSAVASTCRPSSRTLTTTGRRSWADKVRPPPIAARFRTINEQDCAAISGRRCRSNQTVQFRLIARAWAVRGIRPD